MPGINEIATSRSIPLIFTWTDSLKNYGKMTRNIKKKTCYMVSFSKLSIKAGSQYDAGACVTLRRLRVDACCNARIDLDSILMFLRVALLHLVMKIAKI